MSQKSSLPQVIRFVSRALMPDRFTPATLARLDEVGMEDPTIGNCYERMVSDPADYFHLWVTKSRLKGFTDGHQNLSYFEFERTYWEARHRPNVLLVHYADLKRNLEREMRRVADFLEIGIEEDVWPSLVQAATFEVMKDQGAEMMASLMSNFEGGAARFFHKAESGRWRGVFRDEDLACYDRKLGGLPEDCRKWLEGGGNLADDCGPA